MLGFLTSKLGVYAIIGVLLAGIVGTVFFTIKHMSNTIDALNIQNTKIIQANASLTEDIQALKLQQNQIVRENTNARIADNTAYIRVQASSLTAAKSQQLQTLRKKKAQLIINVINKNLECERIHFTESGKCVNGNWKAAA
jgi:hypothetical protein